MSLRQQYLLDLIAPPVLGCSWWLLSRGWAMSMQAGEVSDRTVKRQKRRFFMILALLYALMFGTTTYLNFAH